MLKTIKSKKVVENHATCLDCILQHMAAVH